MPKFPFLKTSLSLLAMMLLSISLCGQKDCEDFVVTDKVLTNCKKPLPSNVLIYNAIAKHFEIKDTIDYTCIHHNNQYGFRNKYVELMTVNPLPNGGEELIMETNQYNVKISRQHNARSRDSSITSQDYSFQVIITFDDNPVEVLRFANDIFVQYESTKGRKSGLYEEKYCNGSVRLSGQYCLIDSTQRDTMVVFNPNTLEEETVITTSYVHSKKTGTWTYYDINGIVEKQEEFGRCK